MRIIIKILLVSKVIRIKFAKLEENLETFFLEIIEMKFAKLY